MTEVIKFRLKGPNAIIRKPESNHIYFTYNNVHKIMLLGLLGAIIGENGYNYNLLLQELKQEGNVLPEFYENLKELKIAIVPNSKVGTFTKKIQQFNNSVGYASFEEGNNLIVSEQYLEKPDWDIYILSDHTQIFFKLKEYLLNKKCEYIPYIGKNEHFADICDVEVLQANECKQLNGVIDSIFTDIPYSLEDDFFDFDAQLYSDDTIYFEYKEMMPTALDAQIGYDHFKEFTYTNKKINTDYSENLFEVNNKKLYFF
ncbi:MAG: type I-B CRISPR-associated protein Cas5b [Clostridia bacterium]|nr:type I-B CRISPR-associated protein Cas5b [Clostridia bacterium]